MWGVLLPDVLRPLPKLQGLLRHDVRLLQRQRRIWRVLADAVSDALPVADHVHSNTVADDLLLESEHCLRELL